MTCSDVKYAANLKKRIDLIQENLYEDEAAEYLRTRQPNVAMLRKLGLLRFVRLGRNFIYRKEWLDQFIDQWAGYDLSSESKIRAAIAEKNWKAKHER